MARVQLKSPFKFKHDQLVYAEIPGERYKGSIIFRMKGHDQPIYKILCVDGKERCYTENALTPA